MASCQNDFGKFSVPELREYLMARGVPCGTDKKDSLVQKSFFTSQLDLPVKPTETESQCQIKGELERKLVRKTEYPQ